jgi:hypothetical protein
MFWRIDISISDFQIDQKDAANMMKYIQHQHQIQNYALQRHRTENWKQIFPEKKLRSLNP